MSNNLEAKKAKVAEIKELISKSKSVVFVDYKGLTVAEDTDLRKQYRNANVEYKVLKNRLVLRAFDELGIKGLDKVFEGPTALAFSPDEVSAAKIAKEGGDKLKKTSLKGGVLDGKVLSVDEVKVLASIPTKEVLVAQLLGMLTTPVRSLAVVLDQIAKQKA